MFTQQFCNERRQVADFPEITVVKNLLASLITGIGYSKKIWQIVHFDFNTTVIDIKYFLVKQDP